MSEYQVEKQRAEVTIYLTDGEERQGVLFLSPFSSLHSGPQTLVEFLHEEEPFVPFIRSDDSFRLLNKRHISHVRYQPQESDQPKIGTEVKVSITFINGKELAGTAVLETPEGKGRLLDFLNGKPGYFSLDCGDGEFYLVNPRVIVEISDK
ncbi:MAG: hypothetical protein C0623_06340 [Desulfuromonas sp.]|nr:MAG: hypothetical protein C0623_06340 [Desulfuromonas sp.]